jgi:hypothetical protein
LPPCIAIAHRGLAVLLPLIFCQPFLLPHAIN